jgi:hypothetical protein
MSATATPSAVMPPTAREPLAEEDVDAAEGAMDEGASGVSTRRRLAEEDVDAAEGGKGGKGGKDGCCG